MTSKVVKGSLWTFGGQLLPLIAGFFATPFVIRLLGTESYGVYILIILIPSYFSFADFGMNLASTKFASERYAAGSKEDEAKIVRTTALIAFLSSLPFAVALMVFSHPIIAWLNVPENLQREASLALKIASTTFVLNILCNIFNTPQLTRLRMDLNTLINASFRLIGIIAIPIVLYIGGGIIGAISVLLIVAFFNLLGHLYISGKLLNELFQFSIARNSLGALIKFGGSLVIAGIAAILLINLEKAVLARVASVESLAYYSVAFTFASMATMFSSSMVQSLVPAFSQLLSPEKKGELNQLFSRSLRGNIIGLIPLILFLFVIAQPFFTIWAGENFGLESSKPFYFLLFGLLFNVITYIPQSILMAAGRADIFAKLYWLELFPYIFLTAALTFQFGATGAAIAWSLRVIADAVIILYLAKKNVGVSLSLFRENIYILPFLLSLILLPILIKFFVGNYSIWLFVSFIGCILIYFFIVWNKLIEVEEKNWIRNKLHAIFNR